jgi:serine/threonine protein kinase
MEFCPGGNLRNLLVKSRVYPSEEKSSNYINLASTLNHRQLLKIAADIANGMDHLATHKVYEGSLIIM